MLSTLVALYLLLDQVDHFLTVPGDEVFKRASGREVKRDPGRGTMDEFQDDRPGKRWVFVDETGEGLVSPEGFPVRRLGVLNPFDDEQITVARVTKVKLPLQHGFPPIGPTVSPGYGFTHLHVPAIAPARRPG